MSLQLLQNYDSEDSSSAEQENGDAAISNIPEKKSQQKLPLPSVLNEMFDSEKGAKVLEDPSQHDGRVRSFAHVRGNWVSFVNISLNNSEAVEKQKDIFETTLLDLPDHGIHLCSDFHLSLTKTLSLRHHWIDEFISVLKQKFSRFGRFDVVYDEFEVYVNDENTRTFIGMKIHSSNQLELLIRECDSVLAEYDLEPYYEDASFHVSIGWTLGSKAGWLKKSLLPQLNSAWRNAIDEDATLQFNRIVSISLKTGNKLFEFPLQS